MELFQIDEKSQLFIGPDIDDWQPIIEQNINIIFDLDGDVDMGVPSLPNQLLYIYFPFEDRYLPDLQKLHSLAQLGANAIANGSKVLSHCGMGHNRSALLAGLILTYLGMNGKEAVVLLRQKRRGALYNKNFASYLELLPSAGVNASSGDLFSTVERLPALCGLSSNV